MGVVFFIGFLLLVILAGIAFLLLGIIGMIVTAFLRKKGKLKNDRPQLISSSLCLHLAAGCLALPLLYFGSIFTPMLLSTLPLIGYIPTDIVIEEKGYQAEHFTAKDEHYSRLPFTPFHVKKKDAVFTYKNGELFANEWAGNYYALSSSGGFRLVHDGDGRLFCPDEEREAVLSYYHYQQAETVWVAEYKGMLGIKKECTLNDTLGDQLSDLKKAQVDLFFSPFEPSEDSQKMSCYLVSSDEIVLYHTFTFELFENEGYWVIERSYKEYVAVKLENDLFEQLKAAAG
ncbi:MAG: hypothetical protein IJX08_00710 [Clostridia bacterium]|nr:hypothetical protein [Clostridia bacterium]